MSGKTPNPATSHDNAGIAAWRFKMVYEVDSYESARTAHDELYHGTTTANAVTDRCRSFGGWEFERTGYRIGPQMYVTESYGDQGDYLSIWLYEQEIIRYYADGTFSVDCGDWTTPTTRERLNAVLPDGYRPYFHDHRLGLYCSGSADGTREHHPYPGRAKTHFAKGSLWPLYHGVRIDAATGSWVFG